MSCNLVYLVCTQLMRMSRSGKATLAEESANCGFIMTGVLNPRPPPPAAMRPPTFLGLPDSAKPSSPVWLRDRVYFVSDHGEGDKNVGNGEIYSVELKYDAAKRPGVPKMAAGGCTRHTFHDSSKGKYFYPRNLSSSDGLHIAYSLGRDVWIFDAVSGNVAPFHPTVPVSMTALEPRYLSSPSEYLESVTLHPNGHKVAVVIRGALFEFGTESGPPVSFLCVLNITGGPLYELCSATSWMSSFSPRKSLRTSCTPLPHISLCAP